MSGKDKKVIKKGTKLSLTKKATKNEVSSTGMKNGIRNILDGNIDLNETCEFRDPLQFSGCGDRNAQHDAGRRGKTDDKAYKSVGEEIPPRFDIAGFFLNLFGNESCTLPFGNIFSHENCPIGNFCIMNSGLTLEEVLGVIYS